ncbi:hypothetical protein JOD29_002092 [Lysinibacillus composti]|uniref:Uncharacterized protein n=1 Tax=Lysinibacillus composti TaxID=720633 RepID=A0A3N9UDT2_9BACI|nr:hypothetical protein [Lysinibacillus composti]MBM7608826.1 hypothetical protein [Lysinibacillus composti]RQW74408.1 hypothetical protein EBB45_10990 [Lysinibacillus composti]
MIKRAKNLLSNRLNERGGSSVKVISITLILLFLISGAIGIYYQFKDRANFSEEEIQAAQQVAQHELAGASAIATETAYDDRIEVIQSLGYSEPEVEKSTYTFEKHTDSDVYILLKLQPHEAYPNLSRVLIQIFNKENGSLISNLENVLTWKES